MTTSIPRSQPDCASELLPCPFCGPGHAVNIVMQHEPIGGGWLYEIVCQGCSVTMPCDDSEAEAIADWNRRAQCGVQTVDAIILAARECVGGYPVASGIIHTSEGDGYGWLRALRLALEAHDKATLSLPEKAEGREPDFDAAAKALGFIRLPDGKWRASTMSADRNTSQRWDSAEQIFVWWGRASGNVAPSTVSSAERVSK